MNFFSNAIVSHFENNFKRVELYKGLTLYHIYYGARFHLPMVISSVYNSDSKITTSCSFIGKLLYWWFEFRSEIEEKQTQIIQGITLFHLTNGFKLHLRRIISTILNSNSRIYSSCYLLAEFLFWSAEKYYEVELKKITFVADISLHDVYSIVKPGVMFGVRYISNSNIISFQRFRVSYLCDYSNFISSWDTFITCLGIFF